MRNNTAFPYYLIYAFIAIITVLSVFFAFWDYAGLTNVFKIQLPITLGTYAQIISGVGSLVLTLGLVLLYGQQTDIQRRQEVWMEAEHVPDVFVDSWELTENKFRFRLSNLGTGVAKNLSVYFTIEPTGPDAFTQISGEAPLAQEEISTRVLPRDSDIDGGAVSMTGVHNLSVSPDDGLEEMPADDLPSDDRLRELLDRLADDHDSVEYIVSLEYDFVRREDDCKSVYGGRVDLQSDLDFEGLLLATEQGEVLETDLNVEPENLKDA